MLPFNAEFQTGESRITQVRLSVLLSSGTLLSMTEEHVILSGFTRDSSTTVDGQFTVGAAVTGKLTVVIDNTDKAYSSYDFRAAVITASLGGQLSDGTYQLVQVGIYTVDDYVYNGSTITLTAYDNLYKFDIPCKTNGSQPTYPTTLAQMVNLACSAAGVTLANVSIPNGTYSITQAPEAWDTMTWHDVIAYCAQIACCWAKVLPNGNLFLAWYDTSPFNGSQLDGGTFNTDTTPYSDGAVADGGDFTYGTTTSYDGGSFGDRDNAHYLGSLYDLSIDTDDVQITGVIVTLDPSNNIDATDDTEVYTAKLGTDGYIITIENNPLIETTADADAVAAYLYDIIVGIRFRPLNASIVENPSVEAGDVALVIDREDNTYTCFLSHVTYTTNAPTSISCDAAKTTQNLKARYGEAEKTRALTQRVYNKAMSNAEEAMFTITTAIATTMGLYPYSVSDGQGGTIYIFGNKDSLAASDIQWKFTAGALMVSDDYGATWNGAITPAGQAVLQEVYAVKVNADNIIAGKFAVSKNGTEVFSVDTATGNLIINSNQFKINANGNSKFSGQLNAAGGTFAGKFAVSKNGTEVFSADAATGNLIINSNQFKINANGNSEFSGQLNAAGGTFAGKFAVSKNGTEVFSADAATGNLIINSNQFKINANGNSEFSGQLNAAGGTFAGKFAVSKNGTEVFSADAATGNLIINSNQFKINANGNSEFSGQLNAAGGTFRGTLSAASGTFAGKVVATISYIDKYGQYVTDTVSIVDPDKGYPIVVSKNYYSNLVENAKLSSRDLIITQANSQSNDYTTSSMEFNGFSCASAFSSYLNITTISNTTVMCAHKNREGTTTYQYYQISYDGPSGTSDRRLKENIEDVSPEIAKAIKPHKFRFKENNRTRYGFIAQEVQEIMPDAVKEDTDGYLLLSYQDMIAPLYALVQEQQTRIDELENRIDRLEALIEKIAPKEV